jgi:cobalt-zinc-cadmium resistance protein CzcA
MNGITYLSSIRSISEFGLSVVTMTFDDASNNDLNRQKVLEKLNAVTLPSNLSPQLGPDYSPVGQVYFYTLRSTNPEFDLMEVKSLEDWVVEKQLKSVPDVIDVSSFGGMTREYQVQVDPNKLISYGLSISQVEQALANNNVNAGGGFIQSGQQQLNVRAVGLFDNSSEIAGTLLKSQGGTPVRIGDVAIVTQGPKVRLGKVGKAIHREDGTIVDDDDVVEGIVLLRKGASADTMLEALHKKIEFLNTQYLPPGVRIKPFLDRSDLVHFTTHTVLHNLTEGILLVSVILFAFLGNLR